MQISAQIAAGGTQTINIDKYPEECPICHRALQPIDTGMTFFGNMRVEKLFRCPRGQCQRLFIARYHGDPANPNFYRLSECQPHEIKVTPFGEIIQRISKSFCDIHAEASKAEQQGLSLICGPGYRKALEFLVKDYVCTIVPGAQSEAVKQTNLARCIKDHVTNGKIVAVASRAAWLGNDETHYLRKWEGKDLEDLKQLINLTVLWIEMEEMTKDIVVDMPENGTATPAGPTS